MTPHVNQIRVHAGMDVLAPDRPNSLVRECLRRNVQPQAYSPLGGGGGSVLGAAVLKAIGAAHAKSTAQVAIRWLLQAGIPAITARGPAPFNTNGYSSTCLAMGFANVRAGTRCLSIQRVLEYLSCYGIR